MSNFDISLGYETRYVARSITMLERLYPGWLFRQGTASVYYCSAWKPARWGKTSNNPSGFDFVVSGEGKNNYGEACQNLLELLVAAGYPPKEKERNNNA